MSDPLNDFDLLLGERRWLDALARSLVRDRGVAEDLAQDVWRRVLEQPRAGLHALSIRSYLGRIVRNLAHDRRRTEEHRAERERVAAHCELQPATDELVERFELHKRVVECIHALEEPYRSAVLLRWFEGQPPRVIAGRLGIPVKTVNTRLDRALAQLRARLDREFGGDRRAWALAFVRAFDCGSAETAGGTVLVAVKVKSAIVALGVVAGIAWWWSKRSTEVDEASARGANVASIAPTGEASGASQAVQPLPGVAPSTGADERTDAVVLHPRPREPHLALRVVDFTDEPRSGVSVTIGHNPIAGSDVPESVLRDVREFVQEGKTGADGWVYFVVPDWRSFEASAALDGGVPERVIGLFAGKEHVFRLGTIATVRGRVTWIEGGAPVADALVAPAFDAHRGAFGVRTDADGEFVLRGISAPKVVLYAFPPGGAPAWATAHPPEGGDVTIDLVVRRGRVARGVVRDARTKLGIPNAVVDIPSAVNLPRNVTTDELGAFEFTGILAGSHSVLRASASGYGAQRRLVPSDVEEVSNFDFQLESERVIHGRVVDPDGRALSGVFAAAYRDEGPQWVRGTERWSIVRSEEDGSFRLRGLDAGECYSVHVFARDLGARIVRLTDDELAVREVDIGDVVLERAGTCSGHVFDVEGAPIPGAMVTAFVLSEDPIERERFVEARGPRRSSSTDARGVYRILDLPAGAYGLRVELAPRIPPSPLQIEVRAGHDRDGVDFRLTHPLAIRGIVLGPEGAPLARADIRVQNGWSTAIARAKCGPDGRFEVGGLQPGTYTVSATQDLDGAGEPGRVEMQQAVALEVAAGAVDLELQLRRVVRVRGRVLDARGAPLARAGLHARLRSGGFSATASANEEGTFVLRCIEKEVHVVLVQRTEPDPDRPGSRRVDPPGYVDLEVEWSCDPDDELVLRVPDRQQ